MRPSLKPAYRGLGSGAEHAVDGARVETPAPETDLERGDLGVASSGRSAREHEGDGAGDRQSGGKSFGHGDLARPLDRSPSRPRHPPKGGAPTRDRIPIPRDAETMTAADTAVRRSGRGRTALAA